LARILIILFLLFPTNTIAQYKNPKAIKLKLSNDMTYFTDRYFSNGIELAFYSHFKQNSILKLFQLPHSKGEKDYYSLTFTHNMYTPNDTYTPEIDYKDHPYATYFLIGSRKESFNYKRQIKKTSEFQIGWMGPAAGGKLFQNSMHSVISIAEYVEGWHNQLGNDICIQYNASLEKGLIKSSSFEANLIMEGKFGSPHSEAKIGSFLRTGIFDNYFLHDGIDSEKEIQIWLFCSGDANFVYYNAVLQGGLNNRNNIHTIDDIQTLVWHMSFGGTIVYKHFKLEIAQDVISPQFTDMNWHRWAYVELMFGF